MRIERIISGLFLTGVFLFAGWNATAQTQQSNSSNQELIRKAKAMGLSQSEIDAAIAAQKSNQSGTLPEQLKNKNKNTTDSDRDIVVRQELPDSQFEQNRELFDSIGLDYNTYLTLRILRETPKKPVVFGKDLFSNRNLTFAPSYNIATPQSYMLGGGDELVIEAWGESELSERKTVSPDGTINIQGIGVINVAGLTMAEAERRIAEKLAQYMGGSQVKVSLGQIRSIKVNIAGEVETPGTYTLPSFSTVFNALYAAGGMNDIGSLRDIKVYRNSKLIASLDAYDYLIDGKYETNIRLEDNDMIIVAPYDNYVSINGKVKRERIYEMKKGETLDKLFEYAGGFTGDAYTNSINVNRKTGRQYSVLTVGPEDFGAFALNDGDSVTVGMIIPEYANRLQIAGAVWRPGEYELSDSLNRLSQLIRKAEGLKGNEFASRGQITRLKSDYTYEVVPFDVHKAVSGEQDIELHREDSVYIPTILELREDYQIIVKGEVNRPDTLDYRDGMTVEDAILMCGGLRESASLANVEIGRRVKDPHFTQYTAKTAEVIKFDISENLALAPEDKRFLLHPFDEVYIRRSPAYSEQQNATISGEILFPGEYTLATAGERISSLIERAGGITPEAYIRGASIERKLTDDQKAKIESMLQIAENSGGDDSLSLKTVEIPDFYPLGVDVEKAMNNPGSIDDIILNDGDRLLIPKLNSMVRVSGSVLYPNTVVFSKPKLKHYIYQGGGYKDNARKRPYVIYMNGQVSATRNCFLWKRYPKIEPGCEVVVPAKIKREGNSLANIMGLMSSTASMAAMIASVINISK